MPEHETPCSDTKGARGDVAVTLRRGTRGEKGNGEKSEKRVAGRKEGERERGEQREEKGKEKGRWDEGGSEGEKGRALVHVEIARPLTILCYYACPFLLPGLHSCAFKPSAAILEDRIEKEKNAGKDENALSRL